MFAFYDPPDFGGLTSRLLICFCRNPFDAKHEYVVTYKGIFYNSQLQKQSA